MTEHPDPPEGYRPCVGVAVVKGGLVWAGERSDAPGAWQMPQGGIDPGETPEQAALRELTEETGLRPDAVTVAAATPGWLTYELPPEIAAKLWRGRYRGQAQRWFRLAYDGPDEAVDLDVHHREFDRWTWLSPAALLERIVPFKRAVYAQALSALRLLD